MAGKDWNGLKWLEIDRHGWNVWKWLEKPGNCQKWLYLLEMARNN